MKKDKKTAEDVYELQCQVLQTELKKKNHTQMELFHKQMEFYDMMKKNFENSCTESMSEALINKPAFVYSSILMLFFHMLYCY